MLRMQQGSFVGSEQDQIHSRTHLGHLLKPGDCAMGFCLATSNVNLSSDLQKDFDRQFSRFPDVILLKKSYGDNGKRAKRRKWQLKRLGEMETEGETGKEDELEEFMQELEEDKEMREHVNIYRKPYASRHRKRASVEMEVNDVMNSDNDVMETVDSPGEDGPGEDDAPVIGLEEMLDDLCLESTDKDGD